MLAQIILSKLDHGIDDLCVTINEFLYWDVKSMAFARHYSKKMASILLPIKNSISRASGFINDEPDTMDEHWIYDVQGGVAFQAIHCSVCGNYVYSDTLALNMWADEDNIDTYREKCLASNFRHIICLCPHQNV